MPDRFRKEKEAKHEAHLLQLSLSLLEVTNDSLEVLRAKSEDQGNPRGEDLRRQGESAAVEQLRL